MRLSRSCHRASIVAVAILIVFADCTVRAEDGLSPELVKSLKRSTVFVKTEIGEHSIFGSGFVFMHKGESVFIVTNNHVVSKPAELPLGESIHPFRLRDRILRSRFQAARDDKKPIVSVIFNSGDVGEQKLDAMIVAKSVEPDLAVLKVTGVNQTVTPISCEKLPTPVETTRVFTFGFPFGEKLSTNKGNPAITVSTASISSIRMNSSGRIVQVQIDGALNPGNSGGPVVDSKGGLFGFLSGPFREVTLEF